MCQSCFQTRKTVSNISENFQTVQLLWTKKNIEAISPKVFWFISVLEIFITPRRQNQTYDSYLKTSLGQLMKNKHWKKFTLGNLSLRWRKKQTPYKCCLDFCVLILLIAVSLQLGNSTWIYKTQALFLCYFNEWSNFIMRTDKTVGSTCNELFTHT